MRRLLPVLLLGAILIASTGSVVSLPSPAQPLGAFAFVQSPQRGDPGEAWLVWTPAAQTPDYYAIYGVTDGVLSSAPIATAPATTAETTLSEIYSGYAVAAVTDGVTSPPTLAFTLEEGCIHVHVAVPPGFSIGCAVGAGVPVHAELMLYGLNVLA